MTFLKQNWFRVVIVLGVTTLVLTISYHLIFSSFIGYVQNNTEEVSESPTSNTFDIKPEERPEKFSSPAVEEIESALYDGMFIRDFEKIPGRSGYLVVFINSPELKTDQLEGCSTHNYTHNLTGKYYVGYVYKGKLINAFQLTLPDEEGIVFRQSASQNDKTNLSEVPLIKFADYTGDGNLFEFQISVGGFSTCTRSNYSIIGYDPDRHNVVVYPVLDEKVLTDYYDSFLPDSEGNVSYRFSCNDYEEYQPVYDFKKSFKFHQGLKRYELTSHSEEPC